MRGECEVLENQQLSTGRSGSIRVGFRVRVTLPGQAPYTATYKHNVPQLHLARVAVGSKLPVLVAPGHRRFMLMLLS